MSTNSPVSHISDTARWVATYRAMETERPDAIFRDPYARKLAGERGEEIVDGMKRGRRSAWPMIVRTAVMDELILRTVKQDGIDTVLNLAAGLDARAYRLPLPESLHWIDVDLPDILKYKQEQLAGEQPVCNYEAVALDLTNTPERARLLDRVAAGAKRALVLTEGLLVYLTPEQVAGIATAIHQHAAFRWWIIDLASPRVLKMMQRGWGRQLKSGGSPLIFAPTEGTAFFEPLGFREAEYRSMLEEAIRLNRTMRLARLWSFIGRLYPRKKREEFRRMSGIVLLERGVGSRFS